MLRKQYKTLLRRFLSREIRKYRTQCKLTQEQISERLCMAPRSYAEAAFTPDSWLFFGKETAGLPAPFREKYRERCVRLPMVSPARSLNLANSAAVLAYEALRQNGFPGLQNAGEMAQDESLQGI